MADSIIGKSRNYWDNAANRRLFFDQYAKDAGFDPLDGGAWNAVHSRDIMALKVSKAKYTIIIHNLNSLILFFLI